MKAFVGGPPCRTVSACRYAEPGPRPVRSEQYPFGFPDLTSQEKAMVEGDTVMFLRMLFLYGLSEEMREEEEEKNSLLVEQPQDPATYRSKGRGRGKEVHELVASSSMGRLREAVRGGDVALGSRSNGTCEEKADFIGLM